MKQSSFQCENYTQMDSQLNIQREQKHTIYGSAFQQQMGPLTNMLFFAATLSVKRASHLNRTPRTINGQQSGTVGVYVLAHKKYHFCVWHREHNRLIIDGVIARWLLLLLYCPLKFHNVFAEVFFPTFLIENGQKKTRKTMELLSFCESVSFWFANAFFEMCVCILDDDELIKLTSSTFK